MQLAIPTVGLQHIVLLLKRKTNVASRQARWQRKLVIPMATRLLGADQPAIGLTARTVRLLGY